VTLTFSPALSCKRVREKSIAQQADYREGDQRYHAQIGALEIEVLSFVAVELVILTRQVNIRVNSKRVAVADDEPTDQEVKNKLEIQ
jgi:hypothetical protein